MNQPQETSVSAIVLNYRTPRDTVACVNALQKQTIPVEIIVVDNHSVDDSIGTFRARFQSIPQIQIIEEATNTGFGAGNNAGVHAAHGEDVLIINPDNVLPPDAVEKMQHALHSHPEAGVVGPALVHPDGSLRPSARQFPHFIDLVRKRLFPQAWQREYEELMRNKKTDDAVDVDWVVGACMLMPKKLFESVGGFDERFFLFFEDIDLCRRIKEGGKKVLYLPEVEVPDKKNRLSGSDMLALTKKTTWIHIASALKYFWKWKGSR